MRGTEIITGMNDRQRVAYKMRKEDCTRAEKLDHHAVGMLGYFSQAWSCIGRRIQSLLIQQQ